MSFVQQPITENSSIESFIPPKEQSFRGYNESQAFKFGDLGDSQQSLGSFVKRFMNSANTVNVPPVTTSPLPQNPVQLNSIPTHPAQTSSSDLSASASLQDTSNSTPLSVNTPASGNQELVPVPTGQHFVDITEYLNMPQKQAAKKLGIPTSTLSKRWKEACRNRKWPYRNVSKLDREITTLLHNLPQGQTSWPADVEETLGFLLRKRQEELRPVVIRI